VQFNTLGARQQLRVVTSAHGVETERPGAVEHSRELDVLIAADAGVRGPAGAVLRQEIVQHRLPEPLCEVPHVEGDSEDVSGPSGVVDVLQRAASPAATGVALLRQRQVHPVTS
jgi:hypothetical protein